MSIVETWLIQKRSWRGPDRASNPFPWIAAAFAAGTMTGAGVTFFGVGGVKLDHGEYVELEDVEGAILLFGNDGSFMNHAINLFDGGRGLCHTALHAGLTDANGNTIFVESYGNEGVHLVSPEKFEGRDTIVIPLNVEETAYVRQAALRHLHARTPYRGRDGGLTCSEFVAACLPPKLRKRLPATGLIMPADLAEALMTDHQPATLKSRLLRSV